MLAWGRGGGTRSFAALGIDGRYGAGVSQAFVETVVGDIGKVTVISNDLSRRCPPALIFRGVGGVGRNATFLY